MARRDRHDDDSPAPTLYLTGADDSRLGVIASLHDHIRPEMLHEIERCVFRKYHHEVDALQRREDVRAIAIGPHRSRRSLESADRFVAVDPDDQMLSRRPRGIQHVDVTAVEEIENAVGKSDPTLPALSPARRLRPCRHLGRGIPGRQSRLAAIGWK